MSGFEYKVVAAPRRGQKAKGVRSTEDRFALAMETIMNELGGEGWDYVRADTLPCDERSGLTGKTTVYQNMLVFRRAIEQEPREIAAVPARAAVVAPVAAAVVAPFVTPEATARSATEEAVADASRELEQAAAPLVDRSEDASHGEAPALGGVAKDDPGNDVPAPRAEA